MFFFFFFFYFFSPFFFSFLLLVFLSDFLLKSSNTPLLFLNFHFHLNITLQKKGKKKERSPIFKLNSIYISKFLVFVFKYFKESNLYAKFFNLCLSVCDINVGHLRIQYSIPISIQECVDYSVPLLTLCFLPQNTSISSFPLLFPIQFGESLWVSGLRRTL